MALAIADGTEDFELTVLYGSRTREDILFYDELCECEKRSNGKVKVVHVLSGEEADGFEHGFLTQELIRKYMGQNSAAFLSADHRLCMNF